MNSFYKNGTLIIILIVGLVGAGFGSSLFAQGSSERTVVITITEPSGGGNPSYSVNPAILVIQKNKSRVPIKFTLNSRNYEFMTGRANGFNIQPNDGNFKINGLSNGRKRLHLIDFNKVKRDYYYTITVVNPETGRTLLIDPRIQNKGGGH